MIKKSSAIQIECDKKGKGGNIERDRMPHEKATSNQCNFKTDGNS